MQALLTYPALEDNLFDEVILIDDDRTVNLVNQKIIQDLLPTATIRTFENGEKGLVYLLNSIDSELRTLVLVDLNMPVMDGFQFLSVYENAISYQDHCFTLCLLTSSEDKADLQKVARCPSVLKCTTKPLTLPKMEDLLDCCKPKLLVSASR